MLARRLIELAGRHAFARSSTLNQNPGPMMLLTHVPGERLIENLAPVRPALVEDFCSQRRLLQNPKRAHSSMIRHLIAPPRLALSAAAFGLLLAAILWPTRLAGWNTTFGHGSEPAHSAGAPSCRQGRQVGSKLWVDIEARVARAAPDRVVCR
jgi:hypothetical protein